MKKILVTVVLGVGCNGSRRADRAASIAATGASRPSTARGSPAQAPVIKDPAEYNAYVGAIQQKDPHGPDQRPRSVS